MNMNMNDQQRQQKKKTGILPHFIFSSDCLEFVAGDIVA